MEIFRGKAHLPGTDREHEIELEIDWKTKEVNVNIAGVAEGVTDWPGLVVQTFGPMEEIVFRTKGIPRLFTHWWHFVRGENGYLWGMVLGLPDLAGHWHTCPVELKKID